MAAATPSTKLKAKIADTVKYKKTDGTLMLLEEEVCWVGVGGKRFTCLYSDIKVQRISPETSSKVQLQILLKDDSSHNFHFSNDKGRAMQMQERNVVKDLLAELIPLHRDRANKELEEKEKIFKENPELYQMYKELVVSNILTAQEFWENHDVGHSVDIKKQEVGISSSVLADIKPDMHGCNELRFNLTADNIEAIFKMYPAVRQKYIDQVPHKTTEKEFWTEFFKSQHFHRDRIVKSSSKDVFGEIAKKDEQSTLEKNSQSFNDPLINFASPSPNIDEGYGHKKNEKSTSNHVALIKQFNHQSMMVLQNTKRKTDFDVELEKEKSKSKRIRETVEIIELEGQEDEVQHPSVVLNINKSNFDLLNEKGKGRNGHSNGVMRVCQERNGDFVEGISTWTPKLYNALSSDVAKLLSRDLSPGGKYLQQANKQKYTDSIPKDYVRELKKVYKSLSELLRHFWSCFPIKTPQLEEKVARMAVAIEKYRDTKLANFRCMLPHQHTNLTTHIDEIVDAALKKYAAWEERKSGVKVINIS